MVLRLGLVCFPRKVVSAIIILFRAMVIQALGGNHEIHRSAGALYRCIHHRVGVLVISELHPELRRSSHSLGLPSGKSSDQIVRKFRKVFCYDATGRCYLFDDSSVSGLDVVETLLITKNKDIHNLKKAPWPRRTRTCII